MKRTPGPWKAVSTSVIFPNQSGGFDIRNCPNPEANARLIAKAPEMFEAIKAMIKVCQYDDIKPHVIGHLKKLEQAIEGIE